MVWQRVEKRLAEGKAGRITPGGCQDMASYNLTSPPLKILYSSYYGKAYFASLSVPCEPINSSLHVLGPFFSNALYPNKPPVYFVRSGRALSSLGAFHSLTNGKKSG